MPISQQFDPVAFKEIVTRTTTTKGTYTSLIDVYKKVKEMYMMVWSDTKPSGDIIKETISPDARNAIKGAIRLMIAADPVFSVPWDQSDPSQQQKSEKLEKAAAAMWDVAGRVRQSPIHYDVVESALLYSRVDMSIISTEDLVAAQAGNTNKVQVARMQNIANRTPYIWEVLDPMCGYPEFDTFGLVSYYQESLRSGGEVLDRWGTLATAVMGTVDRKSQVTYCDYYDSQWHVVWILGNTNPILMEEHGLPIIPIVCQVTEGSGIFTKPEERIQPFMLTLMRSGLWARQNLALTAMFTSVFATAVNGQLTWATNNEGPLEIDRSIAGGYIKIGQGDRLQPTVQNVVDPSLANALEKAEQLGTESTIYKQTLGEPLGGNAPFSMVSLLSQAGRLPLVSQQKRAGWAIAAAMEGAFTLAKSKGIKSKVKGKGQVLSFSASDIPDNLTMECILDVNLPQDDRQNAALAVQLSGGQDPLTSKRWVREKILKIGQSDDMEQEIYDERADMFMLQMQLQQQIQQAQQQAQQGTQGPPPQGLPPEGMPPREQQPPNGMPPGGPGLDQAQQGLPMTQPQGMPPQGPMPGGL